jgi:hypothetical protein
MNSIPTWNVFAVCVPLSALSGFYLPRLWAWLFNSRRATEIRKVQLALWPLLADVFTASTVLILESEVTSGVVPWHQPMQETVAEAVAGMISALAFGAIASLFIRWQLDSNRRFLRVWVSLIVVLATAMGAAIVVAPAITQWPFCSACDSPSFMNGLFEFYFHGVSNASVVVSTGVTADSFDSSADSPASAPSGGVEFSVDVSGAPNSQAEFAVEIGGRLAQGMSTFLPEGTTRENLTAENYFDPAATPDGCAVQPASSLQFMALKGGSLIHGTLSLSSTGFATTRFYANPAHGIDDHWYAQKDDFLMVSLPTVFIPKSGSQCGSRGRDRSVVWTQPKNVSLTQMPAGSLQEGDQVLNQDPSQTGTDPTSLKWESTVANGSFIDLAPEFAVSTPGSRATQTFRLFIAAILAGLAAAALFELLREVASMESNMMPNGKNGPFDGHRRTISGIVRQSAGPFALRRMKRSRRQRRHRNI